MANVVTSGSNAKETRPGLFARFTTMVSEMKPTWKEIFEVKKARYAYEESISLYNMGLAAHVESGDSIPYSDFSQGLTVKHTPKTYGLGVMITMEAMEDNLYESLTNRAINALTQAHLTTSESEHANILNYGFTVVGNHQEDGDGKVLFASDHRNKSGTFSNLLSAASLSRAALEAAFIAIMLGRDQTGVHFSNAKPKILTVPTHLMYEAERIIGSPLQPENQYNAINPMYNRIKVVSWPYLTSETAYFIQTDIPEGLIHLDRIPLAIYELNTDDTLNTKILTRTRWIAGVIDVSGVYGSVGA